jgi:phage-related protein
VLADLLSAAREKASAALERAAPVAEDAVVFGAHRAQDAIELARKRADDVAGAARGGRKGVTGAVAAVGSGVKNAAATTVDTTSYVTRQSFGILFWLAALGAIIMLAFVPDKDKQKEIMANVRQFTGEVREMWHDLQGSDFELDVPDTSNTGRTNA